MRGFTRKQYIGEELSKKGVLENLQTSGGAW